MKMGLTEMVFILDKSGSMRSEGPYIIFPTFINMHAKRICRNTRSS